LMANKDCSDRECFIKMGPGEAQNQIVADFSTKVRYSQRIQGKLDV